MVGETKCVPLGFVVLEYQGHPSKTVYIDSLFCHSVSWLAVLVWAAFALDYQRSERFKGKAFRLGQCGLEAMA